VKTDLPPTYETIDKILEVAHAVAADQPKASEPCPVCGEQLIERNCEVFCESEKCRHLLIESCSGG